MRLGTSILGLLLLATPQLSAETSVEIGSIDDTSHNIVWVYEDGRVAAMTDQPPEAGLDHAWIWSADSAPQRIDARELDQKLPRAGQHLAVRIDAEHPKALAEAYLIAAPVDMWAEIPEDLLPTWPVPAAGKLDLPRDERPWRLRWAGHLRGSWWQEVPAGRNNWTIKSSVAADRRLVVLDAQGHELDNATLTVLANRRGDKRILAQYRSDLDGELCLAKLPDQATLEFVVSQASHLPTTISSYPSGLPETIRLSPGFGITGRFVDADGQPLANVEIRADGWLSGSSGAGIARRAVSDERGHWSLAALPASEIGIAASLEGFAAFADRIDLGRRTVASSLTDTVDLGAIELLPSTELPVIVLDETQAPIAGATVEIGPDATYTTDRRGRAKLTQAPRHQGFEVKAHAEGHLPTDQRVVPPYPEELAIVLHRAFRAEGRFVDAEGVPVGSGSVRVTDGSRYQNHDLLPGGRFQLDLTPGRALALELRSPSARQLQVAVEPGAPGSTRDLGDLQAPPGIQIRGVLLRADDGSPVTGGQIWAPGASEQGDLVAWVEHNLIATTSGPDGHFELDGLPARPQLLRVDASGLARTHLRIEPDGPLNNIGEILLSAGTRLEILTDEAIKHADARVDLRGEWLEIDMLTASVVDGRSIIQHVPPGPATVTVLRGRELLCEERIDVPEHRNILEVDCQAGNTHVAGTVTVGGQPAGGGQLIWLPSDLTAQHGIIVNRASQLGARQQQTFGAGRPQVDVEVDAAGGFWSETLRPGVWQVSWLPPGGTMSPAQRVELPDNPQHELQLDFDGFAVTGQVVSESDQPVAEARVRNLAGSAFAFTDADGGFSLIGLEPGTHRIYARLGSQTSPLVDVVAEQQEAPLTLTLEQHQDQQIEIQMTRADGHAAAGAFVFLERSDNIHRMLTASADGRVKVALQPPAPEWVRAAGVDNGSWQLGPWMPVAEAQEQGIALTAQDTGSVHIESQTRRGWTGILSAEGWDISRLMTRLGMRLTVSPEQPLEVHHLPVGDYLLAIDDFSSRVAIRYGDLTTVEIP